MTRDRTGRVVIVGAGPCGLACARELRRMGNEDWVVFERDAEAGGHAGSFVDPQGFTWDFGGHVVFSHFGEFDRLLEEAMGEDVYEHERSSYIHFGGRWVPYPFQNNLRYLESGDVYDCLLGLIDANGGNSNGDFASWMQATFGSGITDRFMRPYNKKVWATAPEEMSATWIADRVSVLDYRRALRNVLLELDDAGWGPNNTFKFPRTGGTGEIYRRIASALGEQVEFGRELVRVNVRDRTIVFADGSTESYDVLVSTLPIDGLVATLDDCPQAVREAALKLRHNGIRMVGIGYEKPLQDDRSWMYFPGDEAPFYRATNFAKYSPANVPGGDTSRYCSYMTETSYAPPNGAPLDLEERVMSGLVKTGLVEADASVASVHMVDVPYAYPIPTLDRDSALGVIQSWLMEQNIYSRGRFGSWRYEIGNMDHAVKMGIDTARHLVEGAPEELWES